MLKFVCLLYSLNINKSTECGGHKRSWFLMLWGAHRAAAASESSRRVVRSTQSEVLFQISDIINIQHLERNDWREAITRARWGCRSWRGVEVEGVILTWIGSCELGRRVGGGGGGARLMNTTGSGSEECSTCKVRLVTQPSPASCSRHQHGVTPKVQPSHQLLAALGRARGGND